MSDLKRNTELLPKRIIDLSKELDTDLKLSELNLNEKALACPGIKSKWLQILFEEEAYLKQLERAKEKLLDQYKEKYGTSNKPRFIVEAEATKQKEIIDIDNAIKKHRDVVRFVDGANKIMMSFNFEIANSIKIQQLQG